MPEHRRVESDRVPSLSYQKWHWLTPGLADGKVNAEIENAAAQAGAPDVGFHVDKGALVLADYEIAGKKPEA